MTASQGVSIWWWPRVVKSQNDKLLRKRVHFSNQYSIKFPSLALHCNFLCIRLWRVQKVSIIVCINANSKTCTSWVECNHIRISIFFLWFILLHLEKFQYQIASFYCVWSKNTLLFYYIGDLNYLDSMHKNVQDELILLYHDMYKAYYFIWKSRAILV